MTEAPSPLAQTHTCCHQQLKARGLWRFMGPIDDIQRGVLNLRCADLPGLLEALTHHPRFTTPRPRADGAWQSRERVFRYALHLKHFAGDLEPARLQVHIDPVGLAPIWWWALPPVPLFQLAWHALDYNGYRDTGRIWRARCVGRSTRRALMASTRRSNSARPDA